MSYIEWLGYKKPKNIKFDGKVYKDKGYFYSKITLKASGEDLYIRWQGSIMKTKYTVIHNYQDHSANEIITDIEADAKWIQRHISDAVMEFYFENKLDLGNMTKILRPIK